jgi:hypothetical protein
VTCCGELHSFTAAFSRDSPKPVCFYITPYIPKENQNEENNFLAKGFTGNSDF